MSNEERRAELALWMEERRITVAALPEAMGVTHVFVSKMLQRDTIPAKRRKQMIALGFPEELLPPAFAGPFGRPRSTRFFGARKPQESISES